ncbi:MAG TPA: hypothetical protein VMV90_12845 [Rectinemataceae bacterium]|nr:hypothetical protein [Rectinemataceae bacterium]
MVVTEEELREAWRNGRGSLPEFPPGTRFTPAARDFLAARGAAPGMPPASAATSAPGPGAAGGDAAEQIELAAEKGARLILTTFDIDELVARAPRRLVVHPTVTITDAARERLRAAGIRLIPAPQAADSAQPIPAPPATAIPATAASPAASAPPAPASGRTAQGRPAFDEELYRRAKAAVMQRLGGTVDESLLDSVLRRVLSSM